MEKTTVYLPAELKAAVKRAAALRKVSEAQVIRVAIEHEVVGSRVAELAVLGEMSSGAWTLAQFSSADLEVAARVVERYSDQRVGLADASNVVLADRYDSKMILTLDRRHFTVLRPINGGRSGCCLSASR